MSILADHTIRILGKAGLAVPWDESLVNPASLDVRLGKNILVETNHEGLTRREINGHWQLAPGEFVLAETLEYFQVPRFTAAYFSLKSSRAREGFEHLLAGYVDPGYEGRLTLELTNCRCNEILYLVPGMKIGQLVFHRMDQEPEVDYSQTGRYQGDLMVQGSKG